LPKWLRVAATAAVFTTRLSSVAVPSLLTLPPFCTVVTPAVSV